MDNKVEEVGNNHESSESKGFDILDAVATLVRWKRFIVINVVATGIIAAIIALLLPKWYKATASIIPPRESDMLGSISATGSLLRGLSGGNLSRLTGFRQGLGTYNYLAILKSRTAMEKVVREFDLMNVYEISDSSMDKAVKQLEANVSFEIQDEDFITVEVFDKDPQRAANMANYFVEILNEISITLGTQESRNNREFIEKRLEESKAALRRAEDSLRVYQERTRTMVLAADETKSGVSAIAELFGMKAKKEVELAVARKTLGSESPAIKQLELELRELEKKLGTFPEIGIESLRLYRDMIIQQKVVEYLVPLYEQARINEQKDVPVLLVLDTAKPPDRKSKPQRLLIVSVFSFLSFLASILLVFLMDGASTRESTGRSIEMRIKKQARKIASVYRIKLEA